MTNIPCHMLTVRVPVASVSSSGVTRGLSQGGNAVEGSPLANTQKKLRNNSECGCGCLY